MRTRAWSSMMAVGGFVKAPGGTGRGGVIMPSFVDMSLRIRTFLAFGLLLLVTMGLGFFALYQLAAVDRASTALGGKAMPSLFQSSQTLRMVINFRREQANRLLSVADEDRAYRERLMNDYSNQ